MKESGRSSQVRRLREQRYPHIVRANTCMCGKTIPPAKPSSRGEGGDRRIPLFSTQHLSQGESQRGGGFAAQKGSQPRLAALGSPFQGKGLAWTLPPSYGRRCPEGAEVGWEKRYERERRRLSQVRHLRECCYPRHKAFPAWERWRAERAG